MLFPVNKKEDDTAYAWMAGGENIARIAIIAYKTPEILTELGRLHVHGVMSKPIRVFGVLAALATAVSIARHETRLKQRVKSLDDTPIATIAEAIIASSGIYLALSTQLRNPVT